ncbi:putative reverse transcriptase zinc-binding domain-containing protein [Helianthus annuus]|nr:putative reverse transcriptase zinc-binding domain-containing protein [Helianthus annuus]
MAWRGNLDRLASRVNLRRRNVEISSVMCLFYNEHEETTGHLFTACSVAIRVWVTINAWCNIPPIYAFEFKDLMDTQNSFQGGKKMKKIVRGLVIISCWCIWKSMNELFSIKSKEALKIY